MKKILFSFLLLIAGITMSMGQNVVDFEELNLEPESHWNGSDESGSFSSGYLKLYNDYDASYASWQGFAYTNETDVATFSYTNYSAASGSGVNNSEKYAIAFIGSDWMNDYSPTPVMIKIDTENAPQSYNGMYISLSTYVSLYMDGTWEGSSYENEKFWLSLIVTAINSENLEEITKEFILADYRFEIEDGFRLSDWTYIDLTWADEKDSLIFVMASNDSGDYGINTPTYFCIDNFGTNAPSEIPDMIVEANETYNINTGQSIELPIYVKGGMQPYSFTWSSENGLNDYTAQIPTASPLQNTTYTVIITDAEGTEITKYITVNVNDVSIDNNIFENLQVYKNSSDELIISNSQIIDLVSVYDITGKLILEKNINNYSTKLSISNFPQGIYMVNVICGQNQITKKIMK
ncbi:MAG: DUF4465 domain-containing protein [Bacteroidales bacterium]|jgi:hypothetical protein|nr:DUF4465 domain-containing protein [Bacteroidales bacterium]